MSFTVSGTDGVLHLAAFLAFGIAAVLALIGRRPDAGPATTLWPFLIALGLCAWVLATLVH